MAKKYPATPRGVFVFPRLTGEADTKFDAAGIYSVKLRLDADKAAPLIEKIDAEMQAAFEKAKKEAGSPMKAKKVKLADAPYTEEDEGTFLFNFKMKHKVEPKKGKPFTQKPAVVDGALKPIADTVRIGGGSEGKVSYELIPFYQVLTGAGVSLRLIGAQVLKLVEFGGRSGESMGFEAEEDGWDGEDAEDTEESTEAATTEGTEDEPSDF